MHGKGQHRSGSGFFDDSYKLVKRSYLLLWRPRRTREYSTQPSTMILRCIVYHRTGRALDTKDMLTST
ncbi:hypothetical protein MPTK1_2g09570 [Marchantia polymorpha subsp. ruderalis]|uniref:Uncharacterized protein n=1 Tax=Marchantia polymorpha TaxID=3197 RepID=A0A2R6W470_MARPO|nr:hypothetical protein MARPO_0158s0028 [Marchantia polymorpha]BBN01697.1 hypothetical protein Mp_2g09570 [Marchantia polymorpha subsp. ruderalis]|eukprot:PTQ28650.1 hypothetical protein MARPO_0158s0028 [Marchantia polymorpha]